MVWNCHHLSFSGLRLLSAEGSRKWAARAGRVRAVQDGELRKQLLDTPFHYISFYFTARETEAQRRGGLAYGVGVRRGDTGRSTCPG